MRKRFIVWLTAFLMVFMLIPVSGLADKDHTLAPKYDYDSLTVGTVTAFSGNFFSPVFGNNGSDIDVQQLLHDYRPVEWNNLKGCYETNPNVVSNLLITDQDAVRTYSVFLCEDLYYSDGSRITAKDYVFSLLLSTDALTVEIGGACPDYSYIPGMSDWQNGKENCVVSGVRILNDNAFSISVSQDYLPNFYELKTVDITPVPIEEILPGCEVKDDGNGAYLMDTDGIHTAETLKKNLLDAKKGYVTNPKVVSGPYVLTSYNGKTAKFEINPYYKGNINGKTPTIQKLVYTVVSNEEGIRMLEKGQIGLLHKATRVETIDGGVELVKDGEYRMTAYPRSGGSFFSFSCERIAAGDKAVRQAIAYCLDKDALVKGYVGDYGQRVDGYYGTGQWMYAMVNGNLKTDTDMSALSEEMKNIRVYEQNTSKAVTVLEEAGWNLNEKGEAFSAGDAVRCKAFESSELEISGTMENALKQGGKKITLDGKEYILVPLKLKLCCPKENSITDNLQDALLNPLQKAGIQLSVVKMPYNALLKQYYREEERTCDLLYLGTNFYFGFDPSATFSSEERFQNSNNCTGIQDPNLENAAKDLISTQAGDVLEYCRKWVKMQECFQEAVPAIFVYSNVYADFYTYALNNYHINADITWTKAIVEAYMGDPLLEANPEETGKLAVPQE